MAKNVFNQTFPGNNTFDVKVNPKKRNTQITISGRDTGTVEILVLPMKASTPNYVAVKDDPKAWNSVVDGSVDLSSATIKRTVTIDNTRIEFVRFNDVGNTGAFEVDIVQDNIN